ncbi:DUF3493 domain-containing protein [Synechococcus sp. M16CYN]|uniref:DUF3493 domain-containing protein n=1 Tax=Synechococcus sp. M16CYN TaxID=3103139 RepID=UPI00333F87B3
MSIKQKDKPGLNPALRDRLIKESLAPWRGLRRLIWFALLTSAGLGMFIMLFRASAGNNVDFGDFGIQISAFILFFTLLCFDRTRTGD